MYKKISLNLLLLLAPLLIFVLAINIIIDTGFIVNNRSHEIAKLLVSGKNVAVKYIPLSSSRLQTSVVENEKKKNSPPKDIIVFGTSRSSEISSDLFTKNTFYNCSIMGGNILDYIALYGLYKYNNMLPKYLIISIDPVTFHSTRPVAIKTDTKFIADYSKVLKVNKDLVPDYKKGLSYLGLPNDSSLDKINYHSELRNIEELFNLNYFQHNLALSTSKMIFETDSNYLKSYFVIRKDGSYSLALQSEVDSGYVIQMSKAFIDVPDLKIFVPSDTGAIYFEYFKKLLISIKKDGVIPIIFISPVNPMVFDNLSDGKNEAIESCIDTFCKQNNILTIGSFNPHKYGYNEMENYFLDEIHPSKSVVYNIFYQHRSELQAIGISPIKKLEEKTPLKTPDEDE